MEIKKFGTTDVLIQDGRYYIVCEWNTESYNGVSHNVPTIYKEINSNSSPGVKGPTDIEIENHVKEYLYFLREKKLERILGK